MRKSEQSLSIKLLVGSQRSVDKTKDGRWFFINIPEIFTQIYAYENWEVAFFLNIFVEVAIQKISKQTLPQVEKVTVQKLIIGFGTVTCNHKVKYWTSLSLLLSIKNTILDSFF